MSLDIRQLAAEHAGQNDRLYHQHVNPRFASAMGIIGFNRNYVEAAGQYLWDDKGRQYLDMLAGYGVFNMGRNHPAIRKVLCDFMDAQFSSLVQMETPLFCGLLAGKLKARCGYGLGKVYLCSTGAESIEAAIKFSRKATRRNCIVYAKGAFHGLTTGALALNGSSVFRENFGDLIESRAVPFGDIEALEQAIAGGDVAALFLEPIQGKGVNIPPDGYMAAASRICRKYGTIFVADEIQTGLGRSGRFLAIHHEAGAEPDIVVVSKSLSGGFVPAAAVIMRDWIYDKVFSSLDLSVIHSSTFGKSNFAAAAGLAALEVLDNEQLGDNAIKMGDMLGDRLRSMMGRFEFIKEIRWRGLMLAIEFHRPKSLKLRTAWTATHTISSDLFCQAVTIPLLQDHAILTQVAGYHTPVIKLIPPLVINEADVDWFANAFEKVMVDLHRFPGPAWQGLTRIAKNAFQKKGRKLEAAE